MLNYLDCFARNLTKSVFKIIQKLISKILKDFNFDFERFLAVGNPIINYSLRKDLTGFTVAARNERKVTTATVTTKTAKNDSTNTHQCSGT